MIRYYVKLRRILINHNFFAFFLSHGGVHVVTALVVLCGGIFFYIRSTIPAPEYRQIDIEFSDSFYQKASFVSLSAGGNNNFIEATGLNSGLHILVDYPYFDTTKYVRTFTDYEERLENSIIYYTPQYSPYSLDTSCSYRTHTIKVQTYFGNIHFKPSSDSVDVYGNVIVNKNGKIFDNRYNITHIDTVSYDYIQQTVYSKIGYDEGIVLRNNLYVEGNNWFKGSSKNPYYHFSVKIRDWGNRGDYDYKGEFRILIGNEDSNSIPTTPLRIIQCEPKSYSYHPETGIYFPINDVIERGGIYILAEDIYLKDKLERETFLYSILVGAALAFLIDILIELIIKWRNLSRRHQQKFEYFKRL